MSFGGWFVVALVVLCFAVACLTGYSEAHR